MTALRALGVTDVADATAKPDTLASLKQHRLPLHKRIQGHAGWVGSSPRRQTALSGRGRDRGEQNGAGERQARGRV